MKWLALLLAALGSLLLPSQVQAACPGAGQTTLTTDGGQTVTFASSTCGQYANGDYWIVKASGSLTITRTSPAPSGGQNGCEIDFPGLPVWNGSHLTNGQDSQQRKHGFDARQLGYLASQNSCTASTVDVATNHTLMLGKSRATGQIFSNGSNITHYIELIEPVTIVSSAPSAGDFRPGFAATSKVSPGNKSSINYTRLNNWSAASITGEPSQGQAETLMRYIIYQGTIRDTQWQNMAGTKNGGYNSEFGIYGKNIGAAVVDVLTFLNVSNSNAVKETMAVRWIQQAIDIVAQHDAGFHFQNAAGHVWPQKAIVLVAASLMNNQTWADTIRASVVGKHWWDDDQIYFTITQSDIDTPRVPFCSDNNHTDQNQCQPFLQGDLGKAYWCDNYYDYAANGADCSRVEAPNYAWIASHSVPIAFILSKLSLLEEFDNAAYYGYLMASNSVRSNWAYPTLSTANSITTAWGLCTYAVATVTSANGMKTYACSLIANHLSDTAIDGSLTGGGPSNSPPSLILTEPSSSTTQVTSAATIALSGISLDGDGTVVSVTATATCDASVTSTGTAAAWTKTIDLPANTACTVSIYATDDDAATSPTLTVSVLRAPAAGSTLADTFALDGTWPVINPNRWVQMAGSLQWANNRMQSNAATRNLFYLNETASNDQQVSLTVDMLPDANNWVYGLLRASITNGTYAAYACTAQNPISYIAKFVANIRVQIGSGFAASWTQGQTMTCRVTGTSICLLQNGVSLGCETDSNIASGKVGAGLWGVAGAADNFVGTSLSGGGDVSPPSISIAVPTTNPLLVTTTPYMSAAGAASDSVGVTSCTWVVLENLSETGSCTGTSLPNTAVSWSITGGVDLISTGNGFNTLQITVSDAAGNVAVTSTVIRYVSPGGTYTYPNSGSTWTQRGRVVQLEGTFDTGACDYVLMRDVTDPITGLEPVTATGADTWSARVALTPGDNQVTISCMDDNGTPADFTDDVSLVDRLKVVTSIPNRKKRR